MEVGTITSLVLVVFSGLGMAGRLWAHFTGKIQEERADRASGQEKILEKTRKLTGDLRARFDARHEESTRLSAKIAVMEARQEVLEAQLRKDLDNYQSVVRKLQERFEQIKDQSKALESSVRGLIVDERRRLPRKRHNDPLDALP